MFGFGRKAQGSGGSKFGYADIWPMFGRFLGGLSSFEVRAFWGDVRIFNVRFLGDEPKFGWFKVQRFGIFGFVPALLLAARSLLSLA